MQTFVYYKISKSLKKIMEVVGSRGSCHNDWAVHFSKYEWFLYHKVLLFFNEVFCLFLVGSWVLEQGENVYEFLFQFLIIYMLT